MGWDTSQLDRQLIPRARAAPKNLAQRLLTHSYTQSEETISSDDPYRSNPQLMPAVIHAIPNYHVKVESNAYRPPFPAPAPPLADCFETLGAVAPPWAFAVDFLVSLSLFSVLALVMAAARAAARTSGLAVRLAMMEARSAPTIPR